MNVKTDAFGKRFRELLIEKRLTLREVARRSGVDAANLSRFERGKAYPPQKRETLEKLAKALEISGKQKQEFFDLAALVNGMLPLGTERIRKNSAIPLLMRAIDGKQLSEDQVRELAEAIEKENSWHGRVVD
jgi:transcriptional regulator with XRE-family HTH domain